MNQHLKNATLKPSCERNQSTVERAAHCQVRISLLLGSKMFRYFLSHPPYVFDIRKSYVTTTGKTCCSFTIARTCLARSGTKSNRHDVRKTFLGKTNVPPHKQDTSDSNTPPCDNRSLYNYCFTPHAKVS
jgi:hypothetical protein